MRAPTLNAMLFTSMSKTMGRSACLLGVLALAACGAQAAPEAGAKPAVTADYVLTADQTHNKFSAVIPPVITVPSGAVIEAYTLEATGGQLALGSTIADMEAVDSDLLIALTGPVYVEGAEPGDTLAVTLIELEPGEWGWTGVWPDFGLLAGEENHFRHQDLRA